MLRYFILGWLICFGLCMMLFSLATDLDADSQQEIFSNGLSTVIAGIALGVLV